MAEKNSPAFTGLLSYKALKETAKPPPRAMSIFRTSFDDTFFLVIT